MSTLATVSYVAAYFPFKTLQKIESRPTFDSLKKLKKMIKANASSVVSNLCGGSHGHLGLVIPESEYTKITGTVHKKTEYPGELKIKDNTELHFAIILRELHNEKLQLFRATITVESILKSQIIASIDSIYLKELKIPQLKW